MKINKSNLKNRDKNRTEHSIKSNAYNKYCTRHKNIEYVFIVWCGVHSKKRFLKSKIQPSINTNPIYKEKIFG